MCVCVCVCVYTPICVYMNSMTLFDGCFNILTACQPILSYCITRD